MVKPHQDEIFTHFSFKKVDPLRDESGDRMDSGRLVIVGADIL